MCSETERQWEASQLRTRHTLESVEKGDFMKKTMLALVMVLGLSLAAQAGTIATFADPAADGSIPLFMVDTVNGTVNGGWSDSNTGLILEADTDYIDAWFTMSQLNYAGGMSGGDTSAGVIKFYADGTSDEPILQIDFERAHISPYGLSGSNIFTFMSDEVSFSGDIVGTPAGTPANLTDGSFGFSFANQAIDSNGFTSTAAFTSSAAVPEPATIAILALGTLPMLRRRKIAKKS